MSAHKTWIQKSLERCEQATPGPWRVLNNPISGLMLVQNENCRLGVVSCSSDEFLNEDMRLIVDARMSLPRALKLLEKCKYKMLHMNSMLEAMGLPPYPIEELITELESEE